MNVLVVGGSGFLSGHVTREAMAAGHSVTVITRGQRPVPDGATAIIADRKDAAGFAAAIDKSGMKWDIAIDCIGYSAADAEQDVTVIAPRCGHMVFVSTDFVYSSTHRPFPVDETFASYEQSLAYGTGKRAAELVMLAAAGRLPVTVVRPCHIYGPGSLLGCLPLHGRDPKLIDRLRAGETLKLVGGGHFLQQPIFAPDLARLLLSCHGKPKAAGEVFLAAGPEVIESRRFYEVIAEILGVTAAFEEVRVSDFLRDNPDKHSFCCHRVYNTQKAATAGLTMPTTSVAAALREHVESILGSGNQ
jgi:nucleoside-diphosphate-sugar epimerase